MNADTIFALSSGAGRAAVAVIRISGPRARFGLETLVGSLPSPRLAAVRTLRHGACSLDRSLVLWLPGPSSFTGEDMAEIQCHGGRAVVAAIMGALVEVGFRGATPGEFTRRALANGKLTLPEVEGLSDLLEAETAAQHRQALAQAGGLLTRAAEQWRADLIRVMALVEAHLDFADEGDVADDGALAAIADAVMSVRRALEAGLRSGSAGVRLRDGLTIVLTGPVNAGKSSLLNALAARDVAIVTDIPGTTRDVIEVALDLGGIPVTVVDTAGIRETVDPVEREGIRRALASAERADLVLRLSEAGSTPQDIDRLRAWTVITKIDSRPDCSVPAGAVGVSVVTGEGLDLLTARLTAWATEQAGGEPALATRERHVSCLRRGLESLDRASAFVAAERLELVAEDLRLAVRALDALVGRIDVEHVLDSVFATFCIGK